MEFMDLIEIPRVDNIKYYWQTFNDNSIKRTPVDFIDGSINLTSHHLIFNPKDKQTDKELWVNN
jgi:hypothetical protein